MRNKAEYEKVENLKKALDLMAEYIVAYGRIDYILCDEIPHEQHLKYFPENDGNYDNETCEKCVKEYFLNVAEEKERERNEQEK